MPIPRHIFALSGLTLLLCAGCGQPAEQQDGAQASTQKEAPEETPDPETNIVDEQEPNNNFKQTQTIGFQKTIRGTLGPVVKGKGDEDWFVVEVPAKRRIKASLTAVPEIDLSLTFFNAAGEYLIAINNRGVGEGEDLPVFGLPEGKTLIRVREVLKKGATPKSDELHPYLLSLEELPDAPEEEFEMNNKRVDANEITIGQESFGYLAWKGDEDWFKVSMAGVEEGALMRVDFKGVAGVTPQIQIYDNIEDKILEMSPIKPEEPLTRRNIAVQKGPNFDVYYVVVKSLKGYNIDERYTLAVSFEKGGGDTELEPNDDRKKATPIGNGQNLAGTLSQKDVDYYRVVADAPAILRAEVEGVEGIDLRLEVQDANGKTLFSVNEGGKKEGEVVPDVAIPMGESFIKVFGGKGEFNDSQPYILSVLMTPQDGTVEIEPNNDPKNATEIAPGLTLSGYYYPKKDVDYYRLDLSSRMEPVALEITVTGIPKVDFTLTLLDAEKNVIATAAEKPADENESIRATLDPGIYDIRVEGKNSNPRDYYQLRVEER